MALSLAEWLAQGGLSNPKYAGILDNPSARKWFDRMVGWELPKPMPEHMLYDDSPPVVTPIEVYIGECGEAMRQKARIQAERFARDLPPPGFHWDEERQKWISDVSIDLSKWKDTKFTIDEHGNAVDENGKLVGSAPPIGAADMSVRTDTGTVPARGSVAPSSIEIIVGKWIDTRFHLSDAPVESVQEVWVDGIKVADVESFRKSQRQMREAGKQSLAEAVADLESSCAALREEVYAARRDRDYWQEAHRDDCKEMHERRVRGLTPKEETQPLVVSQLAHEVEVLKAKLVAEQHQTNRAWDEANKRLAELDCLKRDYENVHQERAKYGGECNRLGKELEEWRAFKRELVRVINGFGYHGEPKIVEWIRETLAELDKTCQSQAGKLMVRLERGVVLKAMNAAWTHGWQQRSCDVNEILNVQIAKDQEGKH